MDSLFTILGAGGDISTMAIMYVLFRHNNRLIKIETRIEDIFKSAVEKRIITR